MKCVIITEKKVIDLGKWCLSKLRNIINDEYLLTYNEVKRLRTLFFLACQKVYGEKLEEKGYSILKNISEELNENKNEVWNEKLQEKFYEALMITEKSKIGDYSKIEEVFKTPVFEKYSKVEFSLKETYEIIDLINKGVDKCFELNEDLFFDINDFKILYKIYNFSYKILDRV